MSDDVKKDEAPQREEPKEIAAVKQLGGPYAAILAIIMSLFGAGGMFSVSDLGAKIEAQTAKIAEMSTAITRMEAREASFQESISVAKALADRHEERIRQLEQLGIQREGRISALERLVDEMRRGK